MTDHHSSLISFIAGFAYGFTNVITGQPLDTIKTKLQVANNVTNSRMSALAVGLEIYKTEGLRGLYRGGLSLVVGGGLIRSAQFGVYNVCLSKIREHNGLTSKDDKIFKVIDPQIVFAGMCGGIGRGIVEGPFEYVKVRRQVNEKWKLTQILSGSSATILRNCFLFGSFVVYIDISKQVVEGGLSPFMTGAVCSNLAWMTIWPLDVAKTQLQSGKYKDQSLFVLVKDIFTKGYIFRGLVPGLLRSTIANGCSMVAYKRVEDILNEKMK